MTCSFRRHFLRSGRQMWRAGEQTTGGDWQTWRLAENGEEYITTRRRCGRRQRRQGRVLAGGRSSSSASMESWAGRTSFPRAEDWSWVRVPCRYDLRIKYAVLFRTRLRIPSSPRTQYVLSALFLFPPPIMLFGDLSALRIL
jgi:hypothetical protein